MDPLLSIDRLTTVVGRGGRTAAAVDDVSFTVARGEALGLVGESGSGKTLTALSVLRVLPPGARIAHGRIRFDGTDLTACTDAQMQAVRGAGIGLVPQDSGTALNPVLTIGYQVAEMLVVHGRAGWAEARRRALDVLADVGIPDPARRVNDYPHQLSGGLQQRVLIALAIACRPPLLMADEPTSALDVTTQAVVVERLETLAREHRSSLLLITHDLAVVARTTGRVLVMYAGQIVEEAPTTTLFAAPRHPYTQGLLASIPQGPPGARLHAIPGQAPTPGSVPRGCAFAPRCPDRFGPCADLRPELLTIAPGHRVRCHLYGREPASHLPSITSDG